MIILIALAAFVATFLGGFFALQIQDRLHLILGFSAGAVVAVAFFDLLPEAIELAEGRFEPSTVLAVTALGFAFYLMLDRLLDFHSHTHAHADAPGAVRAKFGAACLSTHSFLDGVGLGLAFHVSPALGLVTAAAVLAHDFSDGINTVNIVLKNGGVRAHALKWLLLDAIAPVLGVMAAQFMTVSTHALGLLLALFAGFFLYLGASDLVPESYHAHPVKWTSLATLGGMGLLFIITRLAGI